MTRDQLKQALEKLDSDFRTVPDDEKNFLELQDRMEILLRKTAELSSDEREPLLPTLRQLQLFLKEHLDNVQKQAAALQMDLQDRTTHKQAASAYNRFRKK